MALAALNYAKPRGLRLVPGQPFIRNPKLNFTRASKGWYFRSDGLLKEAAIDEMRFDYDPATLELLGLLIEESRANSLLDSRDMTTVNWDRNTAVVARDAVGIDGATNTACTITDDNGVSGERAGQESTILNDSNTHTFGIFIKKDSDTSRFPLIGFALVGGTTPVSNQIYFNTLTGEKAVRAGTDTFRVEDFGNWWFLWGTATNNGSGNIKGQADFYPAWTDTFGSDVTTTGSAILDQAQVELNASFPTSPIITAGTTVTRSADVATITDLSWYNQSEGAFVVEGFPYDRDASSGSNFDTILELDGGNGNDFIRVYRETHLNTKLIRRYFSGGNIVISSVADLGQEFKLAIALKANDYTACLNGVIDLNVQDGVLPTISSIKIGDGSSPWDSFNGHIRSLHYYPKRLPNFKLQALTA